MKLTEKEIEKIAFKICPKLIPDIFESHRVDFIYGFTTCQELQEKDSDTIEFAECLLENSYMNGTCSYKTMSLESQGKDITTTELYQLFKQSKNGK